MNRHDHAIIALFLSGLFSLATIAVAQDFRGLTYHSLEARIAQSPSVVYGALAKVSGKPVDPNKPKGLFTYTILVNVDDILKGDIHGKTLKITLNGFVRWDKIEQWGDEHASFLLFLDDAGRMGDEDFGASEARYIYLGPSVPEKNPGNLKDFQPIYSMDMTLLSTPKDILSRAREFAKKRTYTAKFESFNLAEATESPVLGNGNMGVWLTVPVVPSLEPIAKHLVETPEDFVSEKARAHPDYYMLTELQQNGMRALRNFKSGENDKLAEKIAKHLIAAPRDFVPANSALNPGETALAGLRENGVEDLSYYKSAANIKLLKSLLSDPDAVTDTVSNAYKYYPVRSKAYDVLKAWGLDVPQPVTVEKIPGDNRN